MGGVMVQEVFDMKARSGKGVYGLGQPLVLGFGGLGFRVLGFRV